MSDTPHTDDLASKDALTWSAKKTAAEIGISTRALWSLSVSGEIPSIKLGSRRLYPVDRLREWLAEKMGGTR